MAVPVFMEVMILLIGAHESTAGGFHRAVLRASEDGCRSLQIFGGPPGRWAAPPVRPEAVREFKSTLRKSGVLSVLVHGRYLANPATPDPELQARSLKALKEDYACCRILGADGLVIHPGSHRGTTEAEGIRRTALMIDSLLEGEGQGPLLLLENTAGSGSTLGASFRHLAAIREAAASGDRVACCVDTAHAFAAGYDLRDERGVRSSLRRIDDEVGLEAVRAFHLNDSARELGSGVDRHARIGEGFIGRKGFRELVGREEFSSLPGILETEPLPVDKGRYRPQVDLLSRMEKT